MSSDNFQVTHHEIDRALRDIAEEDKQAFLYAWENVPELIEIETHPIKFLLREDFDVDKTIKRMALYWKYRYDVFGPERAFRPMTTSGDGVLTPEDVADVKTGAIMILPGPGPTYFMDSKLLHELSADTQKKLIFFYMQVLSEVSSECNSTMDL